MPVVRSSYRAPLLLRNRHFNTIFGSFMPVSDRLPWTRERIATPDDDFLDLDWSVSGKERLLLISHGLEGSTKSKPVLSLAAAAVRHGWDVLAWNYRGCSGEPNRALRFYHSGETEDLGLVLKHALARYRSIALTGFSLGANLTLKLAGEQGEDLLPAVQGIAVVAAPCDLAACATQLARPSNRVYMRYFLRNLEKKLRQKQTRFPAEISLAGFEEIQTFHEYDERYTAPLHGFDGALDYYSKCSSGQFLDGIRVPTLILNAKDDPFLHFESNPHELAERHPHLWLELPAHGGHASFGRASRSEPRWYSQRVMSFLETVGE